MPENKLISLLIDASCLVVTARDGSITKNNHFESLMEEVLANLTDKNIRCNVFLVGDWIGFEEKRFTYYSISGKTELSHQWLHEELPPALKTQRIEWIAMQRDTAGHFHWDWEFIDNHPEMDSKRMVVITTQTEILTAAKKRGVLGIQCLRAGVLDASAEAELEKVKNSADTLAFFSDIDDTLYFLGESERTKTLILNPHMLELINKVASWSDKEVEYSFLTSRTYTTLEQLEKNYNSSLNLKNAIQARTGVEFTILSDHFTGRDNMQRAPKKSVLENALASGKKCILYVDDFQDEVWHAKQLQKKIRDPDTLLCVLRCYPEGSFLPKAASEIAHYFRANSTPTLSIARTHFFKMPSPPVSALSQAIKLTEVKQSI